jgi:hypothetical protein
LSGYETPAISKWHNAIAYLNTMRINNKTLKITAIIFVASVITPIIIYIINFGNMQLSNELEIWSSFGDYLGGILNPIIAFFGTMILGYLTYEVSKQSSDENRNLFLSQQRIVAFQKIANIISKFESAHHRVKIHNDLMVRLSSYGQKEAGAEQYVKAIEFLQISLSQLTTITSNFPLNYGHLFKYDFECSDYQNLKERAFTYFKSMDLLDVAKEEDLDFTEIELREQFKRILIELKKEINTIS